MKIYFTASIVGKKEYLTGYQKIVDSAQALGHTILAEHILDHTDSQIRMETREERLGFQRKLEKWINSCDCMIVESSFPSVSVGYEISLALHRQKPVLVLYQIGDPPALLGQGNDRVVCERYTLETVKDSIQGFLDYVKGSADSRFTFYVTAAEMAHLDKKAQELRVAKAVYLRSLIDKDM
jgi:hypothetical protein